MIYKKGHCFAENKRTPINDNVMIEKHLGKEGIICVEDIVHEIQTLGENFKTANKFLW